LLVTGEEWLEQVLRPALRAKQRSSRELRCALRALADCGVLSHDQVLDALREVADSPPLGQEWILSGGGVEEVIWTADMAAPPVVRGEPFTVEAVRQRARLLTRANVELKDAAGFRDWGERHYREWAEAAELFHAAGAAMYPDEFEDAMAGLAGTPAPAQAAETAIVFLEADPWCFRSGYTKQEILRKLRRHPLTPEQKQRLANALLRYVDVGDRRELLDACKLARHHPTQELRSQLKSRLGSQDGDVARRALLMLNSIRSPNLSPAELGAAQVAIIDGIRYGHGGRMDRPAWLKKLSRRYWTDDWIEPMVALAAEGRRRLTGWGLAWYAPEPLQEELSVAFEHSDDATDS
jgi:hypothetical protein